jgi:hypothetical protein
MNEKEFKDFLQDNLRQYNPEDYLNQQERLDLAFKRALDMVTPEHTGSSSAHPDHPKNPYNVYYKDDEEDVDGGWL